MGMVRGGTPPGDRISSSSSLQDWLLCRACPCADLHRSIEGGPGLALPLHPMVELQRLQPPPPPESAKCGKVAKNQNFGCSTA